MLEGTLSGTAPLNHTNNVFVGLVADLDTTGIYQKFAGTADVQSKLKVYPNPSKGVVYIEADVPINQIKVFDMRGQMVHSISNIETSFYTLELTKLAPGMYLIETNEGFTKRLNRIIIE
jgi:hypothetical protein